MKSIFQTVGTLLFLGLACLHELSRAQTTTAPAAPLPTFPNTQGLTVSSPRNGISAYQGSYVIISALLDGARLMGSIDISVAKVDGSSNTTLFNVQGISVPRLVFPGWSVSSAIFSPGDYYMQFIITPNLTAPALTPAQTSTQAPGAVAPAAVGTTTVSVGTPVPTQGPVAGQPSVYYWKGLIHVLAPQAKATSDAAGSMLVGGGMAIVYKTTVALFALALACMLTL